jgi:hypothetical protein
MADGLYRAIDAWLVRMKGIALKIAFTETRGVQEILELREAGLVQVLRKRDSIAIEKSADQMDEVQYASERDMAIRNVDRLACCSR